MTSSWHSYPSLYALGHKAVQDIFLDPVVVEEKIDGSQFSFGLFSDGYRARTRKAQLNLLAPEKMFAKAVEVIQALPLHEGWTYRGEYLQKPKHVALAYERHPRNHIILFDININEEDYLMPYEKAEEAARIGLETVPLMHHDLVPDIGVFRDFLERISCLGGQKVEGVVVKNYARFGLDKKVLMAKFVSEAYKEVHAAEWKTANPTSGDVVQLLIQRYRTPARWAKAVQHLKEQGSLEGSPRDIAALFKEVPQDIVKECKEEISEQLWKWAWPLASRGITAGLAEWYKEELLKTQFETGGEG